MDYWASIAFLDTDVQLDAARCADELGFAGVAVPDHLFFAQSLKATYPYTPDGAPLWTADMHWPEPWALLSAMAAVTQRVRLSTNIYVAPARDLFTVAKGVSTAAAISHDRVALGVGAGWCEDEFVQTGQDFHTRGKRLDEMLEVLPKLLTGDVVEHHGEFYDFDPLSIAPVPTKPVPVIVGGNSPAAMRRAARVADGWIPAASVKPDDFKPVLSEMRRLRAEAGRDHLPFEIIVAFAALPDPDLYRQFEDLGVSGVMAAPWLTKAPGKDRYGYDADHVRTRMERFAEKLIA
jgi:probable F420-dependent oxidoreductase